MNKKINNIGILDIRKAKKKDIENLGEINNVGLLIYSKESSELINLIKIRNIGCSVRTEEDFVPITGGLKITSKYLESISSDINLVIAGQLSIEKDVQASELDKKISNLIVSGDIICPENLLSVVQKKAKVFSGAIRTFSEDTRLIVGRLSLSNEYLKSLDDKIILSVSGVIELLNDLDIELLLKKVNRLELNGKIILREEYIKDFLSRVKGNVSTVVIPQGYKYIRDDLFFDRFSIRDIKEKNLFTTGNIVIKDDIDAQKFKQSFDVIHSDGVVVCPDSIADEIYDVFEKVKRFIPYKGKIVEVDGEYILTQSELDYSKEDIVYIVNGILDIDKEVLPEKLNKVEAFINFGMISVSDQQFGVVQSKTIVKVGVITTKEEEDDLSGNVGHLIL